ncbi:MAG: hypothetical protein KGL10_01810, partial [Alphaproteobacteria bacterium]|nr:hypothetical protein [Alphaproteobacteria bacterium]
MAKEAAKTSRYALADSIARPYFSELADKRGFEAYQCIRDFLIDVFTTPEKAKPFLAEEKHFRIVGDFQPFDPAYIDNFSLCASIKIKAPDIYAEMLPL